MPVPVATAGVPGACGTMVVMGPGTGVGPGGRFKGRGTGGPAGPGGPPGPEGPGGPGGPGAARENINVISFYAKCLHVLDWLEKLFYHKKKK